MQLDTDAILWSEPEEERAGRPLLVLLHGYGSNEGDLFGLRPYFPDELVVASLRAPLSAPSGWTWRPIEGEGLEGAAEGSARAADLVAEWMHTVAGSATSVGALGFSQGGMLSLMMLRRHPELLDYAVVLSGGMVGGAQPGDERLAEIQPPVFFGYGTVDAAIQASTFAATAEWLPAYTTETVRSYPGLGHSVSETELGDIRAFLDARLSV